MCMDACMLLAKGPPSAVRGLSGGNKPPDFGKRGAGRGIRCFKCVVEGVYRVELEVAD